MKNKKIIILTIFAVALILVGILSLSKLFENNWQNENTVGNNLDVVIVDNRENIFNYPYVTPEQAMENSRQVDLSNLIDAAKDNIDLPESGRISYQEAVNKVGEDIKYLTGFKNHTVQPVVAQLINNKYTQQGVYKIMTYLQPTETDSDHIKAFSVELGADTGRYHRIALYYDFLESYYTLLENQTVFERIEIDEHKKKQFTEYIDEIIVFFGFSGELFNYYIDCEMVPNSDILCYKLHFAFIDEKTKEAIVCYIDLAETNDNIYYPMNIMIDYQ